MLVRYGLSVLISVLVDIATSAIPWLVRIIRNFIYLLGLGWMMVKIRIYLFVFFDESYIKESRIIIGISHIQTLCLLLRVNFSLNLSVTSSQKVLQVECESISNIWNFKEGDYNDVCYDASLFSESVFSKRKWLWLCPWNNTFTIHQRQLTSSYHIFLAKTLVLIRSIMRSTTRNY